MRTFTAGSLPWLRAVRADGGESGVVCHRHGTTVRDFRTARIGPRMQFLRGAAGGCSLCCPPAAPDGRIAAIRGGLLSRYPPVPRHRVTARPV